LIAHFIGNISAKNIKIRSHLFKRYSKIKVGRFLSHGVLMLCFLLANVNSRLRYANLRSSSLYAVAYLSVCLSGCLSVCLPSVKPLFHVNIKLF